MAQLKFSERLIKKTVEQYLNNFIGQKIDSHLITVIRNGMIIALKQFNKADYKIEVNQNYIYPDKINVSMTVRDGIHYKRLDLCFPGSEPELVTQIINEISKYDIDEILNN